jgi:hypothetical protein
VRRFCLYIAGVLLFPSSLYPQATKPSTNAACAPLTKQLLHCPRFGFAYKVPFAWVDRTSDMNADAQVSASANPNGDENTTEKQPEQASSAGSETLLAVFERPPGAPGDTIDSAVVIVAEPLANYRGVKTAAEYFAAISELAQQRGFTPTADPHPVSIGARQLVRGDFTKARGKLTIYQTSLAMIAKGYIVSFTFIGGSEDEVDDLVANLSFSAERTPSQTPKEKK